LTRRRRDLRTGEPPADGEAPGGTAGYFFEGCPSLALALKGDRWQSACMLERGEWAEVKVGNEHLRLFSEDNAIGVQASVYDVNGKRWIAPSEPVDDVEQGKDIAAERAAAYLRQNANLELPPLRWKRARAA
jgi:hypothetical protein